MPIEEGPKQPLIAPSFGTKAHMNEESNNLNASSIMGTRIGPNQAIPPFVDACRIFETVSGIMTQS